ncbi:hypothetical protein IX51_07645 [uncultured archaeon]|nr:hypothetical protein IX51_07645 [uncultured archaeon]
MKCTVCNYNSSSMDYADLGGHFIDMASESDADHIMWLNRFITKSKTGRQDLANMLREFFELNESGLKRWIINRFVSNFFSEPPHLFIGAMQSPERKVLLGYVVEHHHFLKQWIKSCAYVIAKTDNEDVQMYEMENIMAEMHGFGSKTPSHHELLLRMGESLGLPRETVLMSEPLPATRKAIELWGNLSRNSHWIEIMAAMHSLELIATRGLEKYGAKYSYFDPAIFQRSDIPNEVKDFLREGYDADASHSDEALNLIEKYSDEYGDIQAIQATFIRSMVAFDSYLNARLERGEQYENEL